MRLYPHWAGRTVIVAATGPSLSDSAPLVAASGLPIIAVSDAYKVLPDADILYSCDKDWWDHHEGAKSFKGERWSSHCLDPKSKDQKLFTAALWKLNLVEGRYKPGFSFNPHYIHYGTNSGFQAVNLAIILGAKRVLLVGFDMKGKKSGPKDKYEVYHFFGQHRGKLRNTPPASHIPCFVRAAPLIDNRVEIINCTEGSALPCFPRQQLHLAIQHARNGHTG